MNELPKKMPKGLIVEETPPFVPRMVMTEELHVLVREVIRQWKHRDRFRELIKYGIRPLDRVLFYGPPGNGKTMACEWICRNLEIPLYRVRCEQIRSSAFGATTQGLAEIVEYLGNLTTPALCLFDEVEAIFIDRSKAADSCDRELGNALTVFFQALDRWTAPTLIVMCTNLIDQLDSALLSRVEMHLKFEGPTQEQASEVVEYWRELLCEHGADDWGPSLVTAIEDGSIPQSFRELRQIIGRAARNWTAEQIAQEA